MVQVALCQMGSVGTPEENMAEMERLFLQAVENSRSELDLIVFPEYCYYTPVDKDDARRIAIDVSHPHPFIDRMKELAREYHVNLIPGSFAAVAKDGKVSNHSIMLNREGEEIGFYDKIHLFDAAGYKESSYVEAGSRLCLVDFDFGKVGFEVCYDLRFPEQARTMVLQGADIIVVSSEFPAGQPLPPRTNDWDLLVRSCALTNLTYVAVCNQFGAVHDDHPFGMSMVVDPRGIAVSSAQGRNCVVYGEIDLEYARTTKKNLAVWENRRPDVYELEI